MNKEKKQKFYITTPIYYANGDPHLGHAYTTIAADVLARFHRREGKNVFLSTGMDEHGLKIQESAEKAGKDPQEFVDEIAKKFQNLFDKLNIKYDKFIRTTDAEHIKAVQKALQILFDKKAIVPGKYKGLYCVGCEQFITSSQLVDGKCPDHDMEPQELEEDSYLLDLKSIQKDLIQAIEQADQPMTAENVGKRLKINPFEKKNEILSFLKNQDLQDVAISRDKKKVSCGIELPFDKSQITYVWVDAFLNYLTALGWDGTTENIPENFPPQIQLMGKDILRVHATIWPAMLLYLGIKLPKEIFAHGMILSGGKKMSKTLGNVISIDEMIDKFGVDATRYLLMSAGTFGSDVDITMDRMAEKYNADLVNGIGNTVARVTNLVESNNPDFDKGYKDDCGDLTALSSEDMRWCINNPEYAGIVERGENYQLKDFAKEKLRDFNVDLYNRDFYLATWEFLGVQQFIDKIISDNKPWELIKSDPEMAKKFLHNCLEAIRIMSHMLQPFMPETAEKIFGKLGLDAKTELAKPFDEAVKWGSVEFKNVKKGDGLFPRIK